MKTSKILAVILAAILMLTLLTATVFAEEATGEAADVTEEVTGEATEAPADETEAPTEETEAEDHDDHDHDGETTEEDEHDHNINWVDIIVSASIIVLGVIAFIICYFAIPKFREKVKKFFSDYKSELKKVTWSSKEDVRKNTVTTIVVILVLVIVIALLDFIFLSGIEALSHLI
ncbi:MAG: preprotein translocase subunit SecE [Clostridia bacterium]|nr:preprotein translocase subunit SecE [Clostridia bacterium]